jgi:hypothetical protein
VPCTSHTGSFARGKRSARRVNPNAPSAENSGRDRDAAGEGQRQQERSGLHPRRRQHAQRDERERAPRDHARRGQRLDLGAQHARGSDAPHRGQRRDRERQRDRDAQQRAAHDRPRFPGQLDSARQELGRERGQEERQEGARDCAREARHRGHQRHVRREQDEHLARPESERAHHSDGLRARRDPRAHDLRDADSAQHERQERSQAR